MNKDVQRVLDSFEEKTARVRDVISKTEAELKATKDKLEALKTELNNADDPDQYKTILREIHDNESVIEFLENRIRKETGSVLTADESRSFNASVNDAFRELKSSYYKSIVKEIDKLVELVNSYNSEVEELNNAIRKVSRMTHDKTPSLLVSRTIVNGADPLNPYTTMYDACVTYQTRKNAFPHI